MTPHPLARADRIARLATLFLAISFASARAYGDPAPDPPFLYIGQTVVGRSECDTCAPRVCAGQPALVTIRGELPNHCYTLRSFHLAPNRGLYTMVVADFVVDTCATGCGFDPYSYQASVELPPLPAGTYQFMIREQARRCPDTTVVSTDLGRVDTYTVTADCGGPPPPIPADSLLHTYVKLAIVPEHPCAGDSVTLQLVKNGCPPCVRLVSFGAGAGGSAFAGVIDWIPMCMNIACIPETLSAPMGRLNAGSYNVLAPMTVHVLGTSNPDSVVAFPLPLAFEVGPPCNVPPGPCVSRQMESDVPAGACALTLAPGDHGIVPLYYASDLAMAGVQGTIQMPAPFQLTDLQLASGLTGVHLSRQKDGLGMRWLVFTDPGVTLPVGAHQHLLDATVTADPGALNGASGLMTPTITLASGPDGGELPFCIRQSLVVVAVRLCVAGEPSLCDVNHDGRLDVRDLVTMVSCLVDSVPHRGGTLSPCVDCNQDSTFDLSDIFCCARAILRGPLMPADSVRQDASVSVGIGPVWALGANRIVHVRVTGAHALGATNVRLDYPADRWRARLQILAPAGTARPVDQDWYPLMDFDDPGHVYLGALRLGDSGADELDVALIMESTAPALPGDRLVAVGADLAAKDGAVVTPKDPLPALSLTAPATPEPGPGQPASLALSAPRPNPFTTSTSFEVALPGTAQIELAVHDLAGRRVATLASGVYTSGRWVFQWDGAGARGGVYYVRLSVNGQVRSTRVALLRNSR
jgi:hypothetical protein